MRILKAVTGLILLAAAAAAQAPPSAYKLAFTIQESDAGKRVSSKTYTMLVQDGSMGNTQVGDRVQLPAGNPGNFQYWDVATHVRCKLQEQQSLVRLETQVELTGIDPDTQSPPRQPTVRNLTANVTSLVTPGKPTAIATLDDPASQRHYDIEVTASKVP